jgi:GT2 family glycosyltransferase
MIDGRRDYTDWTTYDHPLLGKQCPLPYLDWSCTKYQYINGGYFLVKKNFFINNPLDENLVSHGEEDVEWSLRVRDGAKIICNPRSYVCHIKKHRNLGVQIWSKIR